MAIVAFAEEPVIKLEKAIILQLSQLPSFRPPPTITWLGDYQACCLMEHGAGIVWPQNPRSCTFDHLNSHHLMWDHHNITEHPPESTAQNI